jgi:hypothetical protein
MHARPLYPRSTRATQAAITPIPVPYPSRSATHFFDRPTFVCSGWLPSGPRRAASAPGKTHNQFYVNHTKKEYTRSDVHENRAECVLTLLVKSRPLNFQEYRRALLHTAAMVSLTFPCRMQSGHPGRFCVNQQSTQPITAALQPVEVRPQSLPKEAV